VERFPLIRFFHFYYFKKTRAHSFGVDALKRFKTEAITIDYWKPHEQFLFNIVSALRGRVLDGDILVISEKAISTATGEIYDESVIEPGLMAKLLAKYWMRFVWAFILGPLCHSRKTSIHHFKVYPVREGAAHKQLVLERFGVLQALMPDSEGGVDCSNLPHSYVSLPLSDAQNKADEVFEVIRSHYSQRLTVMIVDSDKTYSWKNFHFTPRIKPIKGIQGISGVLTYVIGRFLKLRRRATPLAIAGKMMGVERALVIADLADKARGSGAGRTIWDVARNFDVSVTDISWEMLMVVKHKPIVIVRPTDLV